MKFDGYTTDGFYDELFVDDGTARPEARPLVERIESLSDGELARRHQAAERALLRMGITFNVYDDDDTTERIFPFDIIPRIVGRDEWGGIERGLQQRIRALNEFIDDVYHDQRIVAAGVTADAIATTASTTRAPAKNQRRITQPSSHRTASARRGPPNLYPARMISDN